MKYRYGMVVINGKPYELRKFRSKDSLLGRQIIALQDSMHGTDERVVELSPSDARNNYTFGVVRYWPSEEDDFESMARQSKDIRNEWTIHSGRSLRKKALSQSKLRI